jgi:hypothetical protein
MNKNLKTKERAAVKSYYPKVEVHWLNQVLYFHQVIA